MPNIHDEPGNLVRDVQPMPGDIRAQLDDRDLMDAYQVRTGYQQNNQIGWIARAKRPDTRQKRIDQMLVELNRGGVSMCMDHPPSAQPGS